MLKVSLTLPEKLNVYDTHNYTIAMFLVSYFFFFLCRKSLSMIVCEYFYGSLLSFSILLIPWSIFVNHHHDFRWEFIWKYGKYCSLQTPPLCARFTVHFTFNVCSLSCVSSMELKRRRAFAQRNLITWKKNSSRVRKTNCVPSLMLARFVKWTKNVNTHNFEFLLQPY